MSGRRENGQLIIDIKEMLRVFSHTPSSPSIYRVSDCLRNTKKKSYEPLIISIGPFHHGKDHLKAMETLKKRYLKRLVGESSVDIDEIVNVIKGKEQPARKCYAEDIGLDSYGFVQMLLLDGVFIIEFLREYYSVDRRKKLVNQDNPIFGFGHVVSHILRDLMLLENQIPLFVLEDLYKLPNNHVGDQPKFSDLIWPFFSPPSPSPVPEGMPWPEDEDAHHLLGLVHHVTCWPFVKTLPRKHGINCSKIENIHSVMELKDAGVLFRKPEPELKPKKDKSSWLNIRFENKTIYIPELEISDVTESWFRNMIAYEYYRPSSEGKHITDYAFFLHCLIHSSKDAEVLRRYGIISNWLGGDARVYQLINGLGTNAQISENFSYLEVFRSVNAHCRLRTNRWFAVLRRNHFNNPWTSISLVAAVMLLSGAILQAVFAILSYRCN